MMKKLIIAILIFTGIISKCFGHKTQDKNVQVFVLENSVGNTIDEKENVNEEVCNLILKDEIEDKGIQEEKNNYATVEPKQSQKENKKIINQNEINSKESTKTDTTTNTKINNTQSKIPEETNQINQNHQVQEQKQSPKDETNKQCTENDLENWCVEGGKNHIAGNGVNEHGYYDSWDDAYSAFENYTKDWTSVQFKISQCLCNKFYFWAIQ